MLILNPRKFRVSLKLNLFMVHLSANCPTNFVGAVNYTNKKLLILKTLQNDIRGMKHEKFME